MPLTPPDLRQHCEQRGHYVIEATARSIAGGGHWHPRLRLTRLSPPGLLEPSQDFQRLKPLFESARAAILYAAELGRCLVDEESSLLEI
jgi:hypothetical protein